MKSRNLYEVKARKSTNNIKVVNSREVNDQQLSLSLFFGFVWLNCAQVVMLKFVYASIYLH